MTSWPNGKALVFGTKDCAFESHRSRRVQINGVFFFFFSFLFFSFFIFLFFHLICDSNILSHCHTT